MPPKKPLFKDQIERCKKIIAAHSERDKMYREMRQMLFMEWDEGKQAEKEHDWVRPTMSPDPYNAIMGIVRLLVSTDPKISVARDEKGTTDSDDANKLEKVLAALWKRNNRARRWPVHYDAVLSASLFSEVAIQIGRTADMVELAKQDGRDISHLQRYARQVPYTLDVVNPMTVYPEFGAFGLRSVTRSFVRKAWQVRDFWGKAAVDAGLTEESFADYSDVTYNELWDETWRLVWVTECEAKPIFYDGHELPFVPWEVGIATGSGLFEQPHRQRFPMLFPIWAGKWWHRQNRQFTQLYTVTDLLANPHWIYQTDDPSKSIEINLGTPGGVTNIGPNESIEPLALKLLDESVKVGIDLAESKMIASTVPKIVFGESPGATMSYSAMNLLTQGGRLPLIPIERQTGNILAGTFEKVLRWIHHADETLELYGEGELARVEPADINPDHIEVDVKMKADVPQDRLQLANVVKMLSETTGADGQPLISRDTGLQFLEFLQPGDEQAKILEEMFMGIALKLWIQNNVVAQGEQPGQAQAPTGAPVDMTQGSPQSPPQTGEPSPFANAAEGVPPVMVGGVAEQEGMIPKPFAGD